MSSIRIQKDVAGLYKSPPADTVLLSDTGSDLRRINFLLLGPESTAYYGGAWRVVLEVPAEYPQLPPKAFFETKIFHPNVEPSTGEVCVDTLKRDWTPKLNFRQIILVS
jgi:ubiquitin-conjugating enzyme E2 S